jgi:hypothetical protein
MDMDRPLTREDWERIVADVKCQNAVCLEQAAELTRLRAELRRAYEAAEDCYAGVLGLPHCEPGYCRCGKAASSPPENISRTTARRLLRPLFNRPVSPEEKAVCDAVTDEIARLRAALEQIADAHNPGDTGLWRAYCKVRDFARDILDGKEVDL